MSACAILGNGPGLTESSVPPGATPIGVNRSYLKVWAPIACTFDGTAAKEMHSRAGAFLCLVPRGIMDPRHGVAYFDPPKWIGQSGPFAIWCAVRLGFRVIHLVGFGGLGHFDGEDRKDRNYQRLSLEQSLTYASSKDVSVLMDGEPFLTVPKDFWPAGEVERTFAERLADAT